MKLIVPHTGEPHALDARLIMLATFLGIQCETLRLDKHVQQHAEYIEKTVPEPNHCFLINPRVMREWLGKDCLPEDLVCCLESRFRHLLVHALTPDSFVGRIISSLSRGRLGVVQPIADGGRTYEVLANTRDFSGPFCGLSFGPVNPANDFTLPIADNGLTVRKLICVGGSPFMATLQHGKAEILFLASADLAELSSQIDGTLLTGYFSRFVAPAMALRYIFGRECWQPSEPRASVIIDDPILQQDYGFLSFETLLRLMERYDFHTTIAFIPHNYRRNSVETLRLFRQNPHRFSICFHGNDHTAAELASTDANLLNTILGIAEDRMRVHEQSTGLRCDRVMVFPQGRFSLEAMELLKSRNFHAAVNTDPMGPSPRLTIADLARPAVLRYAGFPLLIRNKVGETQSQDIAFNVFFGRPVLIVAHHGAFKHPASLLDLVQRVNAVAPDISWSNLQSVAHNSFLRLQGTEETVEVSAYAPNVRLTNDSAFLQRLSITWNLPGRYPFDGVLQNGARLSRVEADDAGIRASGEMAPGTSHTFSVVYRNGNGTVGKLGFTRTLNAFARRRLSELIDNHLSKNEYLLTAAKKYSSRAFQDRLRSS